MPTSPLRFLHNLPYLILLLLTLTPPSAPTTLTYEQYRRQVRLHDRQAPRTENFDPALANPIRNLTCIGNGLHLRLPTLPGGFDPNRVSLQKLCAKPQYGGGAPGQHAGGYCTDPPFAPHTGEVAFDVSPQAGASTVLQNPRVLLTCRYRCFCNWGVADTSVQPKTLLRNRQFRTTFRPSGLTYQVQMDIDDDFTTPRGMKLGKLGSWEVEGLRLLTQSQLARERGFARPGERLYDYVSLDPGNKIFCSGNMPTFDLPPPYSHVDFVTLGSSNPVQLLCATQLSGGYKGANAGGYCHRSPTPTGTKTEVWFSDDMTPRLDWTWTAGNFFASASLRFFCRQHCTCTSDRNPKLAKNDTALYAWQYLPGHQLTQFPDGSLILQVPNAKGELSKGVQVLPPQHGPGSPSGTCGINGTDFCPYDWDESMLGPPPSAPPNTTDIVKPLNSNNATVCGNTCSGPADCGSTAGSEYNCSCALPSSDDARTLGLDPVAPVAVCLALFMKVRQSRIGGRDTIGYVDARGLPHTCRCNETFVGMECCGATNGIRQARLEMRTNDRIS